jgi:hypothetical protein
MRGLNQTARLRDELCTCGEEEGNVDRALTWTLAPQTKLGLSHGFPAALRSSCHLRFIARPANMTASDDPMVLAPMACLPSSKGAWNRCAIMFTHRSCETDGNCQNSIGIDAERVYIAFGYVRLYLQLGGDGVLVHVDVVFVERLDDELVAFGLHPRRGEGRHVQARVPVQHELIAHYLVRRVLGHLLLRQPIPEPTMADTRSQTGSASQKTKLTYDQHQKINNLRQSDENSYSSCVGAYLGSECWP